MIPAADAESRSSTTISATLYSIRRGVISTCGLSHWFVAERQRRVLGSTLLVFDSIGLPWRKSVAGVGFDWSGLTLADGLMPRFRLQERLTRLFAYRARQ